MKRPAQIPYTEGPKRNRHIKELGRSKWACDVFDFKDTLDNVVQLLLRTNICVDWSYLKCPFCCRGSCGKAKEFSGGHRTKFKKFWRCSSKKCKRRIFATTFHPVFNEGRQSTPLSRQAACLFNAVLTVQQNHSMVQLSLNHKTVESIYRKWRKTCAKDTAQQQENIELGNGITWTQVEADEVTLAKRLAGNPDEFKPLEWDSYLGLMVRGRPETLVLIYLGARRTRIRSPGPGPLTRELWIPIAAKWLQGKKVILLTDSARAYTAEIPGVRNAPVVHKLKKVGGRWIKPQYVVQEEVKLDDGSSMLIKKGTQYIDGFWKHLKKQLKNSTKHDNKTVDEHLRCAQWRMWHQGQDMWLEAGKLIQRQHYKA